MNFDKLKTTSQNIFSYMSKVSTYILLAIIGVLIFLYSIERSSNYKLNNNLIVSKDSVKYMKNKADELYAQVNSYVITEKQLKEVNSGLYEEVQKYKKQKPLVITKETIKIEYRDTNIVSSISSKLDKYGNKDFILSWNSDSTFNKDNSISMTGSSYLKIDSTLNVLEHGSSLNRLLINADLILGVSEEKDGNLVMNARSNFPGLTFTYMEGYVIDPMKLESIKKLSKNKRYGLAAFGGIGTYFDGGGIKFVPTVGVGLTYNFFRF